MDNTVNLHSGGLSERPSVGASNEYQARPDGRSVVMERLRSSFEHSIFTRIWKIVCTRDPTWWKKLTIISSELVRSCSICGLVGEPFSPLEFQDCISITVPGFSKKNALRLCFAKLLGWGTWRTAIGPKCCVKDSDRSAFPNSLTNYLRKTVRTSGFSRSCTRFDCLQLFQISTNFNKILTQGRVERWVLVYQFSLSYHLPVVG